MVTVTFQDGMAFEATTDSGASFVMDAYPESGGQGLGPTPVQALLSALAGCTAMDVISILRKKQQVVRAYRIEVDGDRTEEGVYPRPFATIRVKHIVEGDVDPIAVARAIQLSDEKYCTVAATLRSSPAIESTFLVLP